MTSLKNAIFFVVAFLAFPAAARGDVIVFKSGTAKVGIIQEETPSTVKIRVKDAVVGISRSNIERIDRATPEENQQLDQKWKEEKERVAEERAKKREAAEKFEAAQREKGLVSVNGKWVSPAEAQRMKQETVRRQIQSQAAGAPKPASATEEAKPPEETQVPDYINELPSEELKQEALKGWERQKKIEVGQIQAQSVTGEQSLLRGTVTNRSDALAQSVDLEITIYDDAGNVIDTQRTSVIRLKPGESKPLNVPVRVDSTLIKRITSSVSYVDWQ